MFLPAIDAAFKKGGIGPGGITWAAIQEPAPGAYKALAAKLGLKAANLCERIGKTAGDLGAAHALFGLALALEASVGDRILVAGFGSGCDVLILEVTSAKTAHGSAAKALTHGVSLDNYSRFLSLAGARRLDHRRSLELHR